MPQHDRNDDDFWERSRRTRQSDKRSKRGRKRKDEEPGATAAHDIDWNDPNLPSAAPPSRRSGREQAPPALPARQVPPAGSQRPVPPRVTAAQRQQQQAPPPRQSGPPPITPDRRPPRATERRQPPPAAAEPPSRAPFLNDPPLGRSSHTAPAAPPRSSPPRSTRPESPGRTGAGAAGPSPLGPPSGRPDANRAPGTSRRRLRDMPPTSGPDAGWNDSPAATNGPHLASRSRRSPAGAPDTRPPTGAPLSSRSAEPSAGTSLRPSARGSREAPIPPALSTPRSAASSRSELAPRGGEDDPLGFDPGAPGSSSMRRQRSESGRTPLIAPPTRPGRDEPLGLPPRDHAGRELGDRANRDLGDLGRPPGRVTGENPALVDRLEGLASRATPPHGGRAAAHRPQYDDAMPSDPQVDDRGGPSQTEPRRVPPAGPRPSRRQEPGPRQEPPPTQLQSTMPAPAPPAYEEFDEPYGDRYGADRYEDTYDDDPYDDEYEDATEPERRSGCSKPLMIVAALVAVLLLLLLVIGFWVRGKIDPGGEPGEKVRVEVVAGQSTSEIGRTLEDSGIISDASVWSWYVRFKGGGDIQAGVYEIPTNLSMGEALDALEAKPLPPGTKRVTIPEGQTIAQIRDRLTVSDSKVEGFTPEAFDAALADPAVRSKYLPADQPSLEGTFFPETYDLAEDADEKALLVKMRDQFDATMDELAVETEAPKIQRTPYEIMIIASIIEEEARIDEDRPKVARVIYNRLANDEALFIDAINCYEKGEVPCVLTDPDFDRDTPYNSRTNKGLPPTPIAAPGRASIDAALHPAAGDWTFYVLDPALGEGHHLFTNDIDEFNAAKARCRDAGLGCG